MTGWQLQDGPSVLIDAEEFPVLASVISFRGDFNSYLVSLGVEAITDDELATWLAERENNDHSTANWLIDPPEWLKGSSKGQKKPPPDNYQFPSQGI